VAARELLDFGERLADGVGDLAEDLNIFSFSNDLRA
jgi:hypothetical protein